MRKSLIFGLAVVGFVTLCYVFRDKPIKFRGDGAIVEFERKDRWLSVFANAGAKKAELVSMEQFGNFHPGLSPQEAVQQFGQPDRVVGPDNGEEYVEFHNQFGRIRIGKEESSSGWVAHPLYFFPSNPRPDAFFNSATASHLIPNAKEDSVMLFECGFDQPFMNAIVNDGGLTKVIWSEERDLGRRASPTQCTKD